MLRAWGIAACLVVVGEQAAAEEPAFQTVVKTGTGSEARELTRSAEAVTVVKTDNARRESADLGEVLARTEGVDVRRSGGLGSDVRLSLNGLTDDQVRVLVDGIGIELAGYAVGIASIPVDAVERVEIYGGVVPVRFGIDALGGAINVVTERPNYGTGASAAVELGSYDTFRLSLGGHATHPSGVYVRAHAYFDSARNDYPIIGQVANSLGQVSDHTVWRFHDRFRDLLGGLEAGITDRPWADHLHLRVFGSTTQRDLQNNFGMTLPYGEVTFGRWALGSMLHYRHRLAPDWRLQATLGYGYFQTYFLDKSPWIYNWFGEQVNRRTIPGETDVLPHDDSVWANAAYARASAHWQPAENHRLEAVAAPTVYWRKGIERLLPPNRYDPLRAKQSLSTVILGLNYTLDGLDDALENMLFIKDYVYAVSTADNEVNTLQHPDLSTRQNHVGAGDMLRYRWTPWLSTKASYEYAARLPRPDEVFGDAVNILANPRLAPEISHNFNLSGLFDLHDDSGHYRANVTGFARLADNLILLLSNDKLGIYENLFSATSLGVEGTLRWATPGRWLEVEASSTWQSFINSAKTGPFAAYAGDRIPNRPYFFGSSAVRLNARGVAAATDLLSLVWYSRYVHAFFRGWESVGLLSSKQVVPDQWVNTLALTWTAAFDTRDLVMTAEVDNLADAHVYDYYGVQRPGRAVYMKASFKL